MHIKQRRWSLILCMPSLFWGLNAHWAACVLFYFVNAHWSPSSLYIYICSLDTKTTRPIQAAVAKWRPLSSVILVSFEWNWICIYIFIHIYIYCATYIYAFDGVSDLRTRNLWLYLSQDCVNIRHLPRLTNTHTQHSHTIYTTNRKTRCFLFFVCEC